MHILDYVTTAEYMKLRYGNRAPRRWWGDAHRQWLLSSGRYVKTSEQRTIGLMQFIGSEPEPYEPGQSAVYLVHPENPYSPTAAELGIKTRPYPPAHHPGASVWLPSDPGSRHWPGCGCP